MIGKIKIKVPGKRFHSEISSLGLQVTTISLCALMTFSLGKKVSSLVCFMKSLTHHESPTLITPSNPNYLPEVLSQTLPPH